MSLFDKHRLNQGSLTLTLLIFTNANTCAVEGAPSMDNGQNFYYVSTANYSPPNSYATLYLGAWDGASLNLIAPLEGIAIET